MTGACYLGRICFVEWYMRTVIFIFVLTLFSCGCESRRTINIRSLISGKELKIEEKDFDKITPIGWAMALDGGSKFAREAFAKQCKKDPELEAKVLHFFEVKARIDARRVIVVPKNGGRIVIYR
jgi:hypothetical protein